MDNPSILLLTTDRRLQGSLNAAFPDETTNMHVTNDVGEALRTICARGRHLNYAIVDFEDGSHGMTLLRALNVCQPDLPIISVVSVDVYHAAAVAYANGAAACLAKPFSPAELRSAIEGLRNPKTQLALAA